MIFRSFAIPDGTLCEILCSQILFSTCAFCRRRPSGQTLCRLLLPSLSFTLPWGSSFTRCVEIVNLKGDVQINLVQQYDQVLLQAYFDDGKKSIKSD